MLYLGDCLDIMPTLPDRSVDAIIADIPYGTTACAWDTVIPFAPMWAELKRLIKPRGAIVLFGSQPFTSALVMSNPAWFRYGLVWEKTRKTGFLNATSQPLREHEDINVFGFGPVSYRPQGVRACVIPMNRGRADSTGKCYGNATPRYLQTVTNYPSSIIRFTSLQAGRHPTEKPVALMSYLIRTYTNPGDVVLDFTAGVMSTGVACVETGRQFIGIEKDERYFAIGSERMAAAAYKASPEAIPLLTQAGLEL